MQCLPTLNHFPLQRKSFKVKRSRYSKPHERSVPVVVAGDVGALTVEVVGAVEAAAQADLETGLAPTRMYKLHHS